MLSLRELRHHRHAFVNRASDLDNTASIANSFDPSDSSGGGVVVYGLSLRTVFAGKGFLLTPDYGR